MNTDPVYFTYENFGTPAATDKDGKRMRHKNAIKLWRLGDRVFIRRIYIGKDGIRPDSQGITGSIVNPCALEIARRIHWGCCGWQANALQIQTLIYKCEGYLSGLRIVSNGRGDQPQ